MYKHVLQSIDNVAIWPVISFIIFFTFFVVLLWRVFFWRIKIFFKMYLKNL